MTTIYLKNHKEESLLRFHPWVFSGAIAKIDGSPKEGEVVRVATLDGQTLGVGHWQEGSISVRILDFQETSIDNNFYYNRIFNAYKMRCQLGLVRYQEGKERNDTYRLIHGEGDFLPGLIVDVYNDTAVVQAHSAGMHIDRRTIANAIIKAVKEVNNVYYKSEGTLPLKKNFNDIHDGWLIPPQEDAKEYIGTENGLKFSIDWLNGQKTGFFVDQRENRSLVEQYSLNKRVLNMFCYTGGFSVYAIRGGAKEVHSVDSSQIAVDLVNKNIYQNFPDKTNYQSFGEDAFRFLDNIPGKGAENAYDLIILDPPAFAKHRSAIKNALQGYKRLNAKAFEKIASGGILFTFSCSQAIDKEMFRLAVFSAAAISKRKVKILHQLHQPKDHPISIYHPEGEYLKGLVLYVE